MANQNTLGGLNAIQTNGESLFRGSLTRFYIPASDTNAYYIGTPVVRSSAVAMQGVQGVTLATGNAVTGSIQGFVGATDAGSNVTPTLRGLPVGPVYRPASTSQDWYVLVSTDPSVTYSVQVSNTDVLSETVIGKSATLVNVGAGSALQGSYAALNANSVSTGTGTVIITALDPYAVNNDPTQPYAKYLVRLNDSTEVNGVAGI